VLYPPHWIYAMPTCFDRKGVVEQSVRSVSGHPIKNNLPDTLEA
jgi:hypothetical protein